MTPEARPTSAIARTGSVAAASFIQNAIAFVATAYVSRLLGPAGRGTYYLPILTATTVLAFCKLGVDQANVYLLATRRLAMRSLSAQNSLIALTMGMLGVAATVLLPSVWPSLVAPSSRWLLLTASLMIPLGIHTQLSAGLLSLAGKPSVQYHAATVGALAQIALLAVLAAGAGLTPDRAVAIAVAGTALTWAVLTVRIGRLVRVLPAFDGPLLRDTLRISFPLYVSSLLLLLHLRVDMFMVSLWSGARALGLYSVAVVLAETLMLANESVALGILPEQVNVSVRDAALRAFGGVRAMVVIGLALSVAWVAAGYPFIRLAFGADYAPAYGALVALLPGIVMRALQRMCSAPTLRTGRPSLFVGIAGGSLLCNAALNAVLIPRWGINGASAASSISYSISALFFLVWTARLAERPLRTIAVPGSDDWRIARQVGKELADRARSYHARSGGNPPDSDH